MIIEIISGIKFICTCFGIGILIAWGFKWALGRFFQDMKVIIQFTGTNNIVLKVTEPKTQQSIVTPTLPEEYSHYCARCWCEPCQCKSKQGRS